MQNISCVFPATGIPVEKTNKRGKETSKKADFKESVSFRPIGQYFSGNHFLRTTNLRGAKPRGRYPALILGAQKRLAGQQ